MSLNVFFLHLKNFSAPLKEIQKKSGAIIE